jgi:hypothetical protein
VGGVCFFWERRGRVVVDGVIFFKLNVFDVMAVKKFTCSFSQLFMGLELLAGNLEGNLGAFGFKGFYTEGYVADFRAKIAEASGLSNEQVRDAQTKIARMELVRRLKGEVREVMRRGRAYVAGAYKQEEVREAMLRAAGFGVYGRAMNLDWDVALKALRQLDVFVAGHEGELMADGNMPSGFGAEVRAELEWMEERVGAYWYGLIVKKRKASERVEVCNALYAQGMRICGDGKVVFGPGDLKRRKFNWASIMRLVKRPGASSLRIGVRDVESNEWMAGVTVRLQRRGLPEEVGVTNEKGVCLMKGLKKGRCVVVAEQEGYERLERVVVLKAGVRGMKQWWMVKGAIDN